MNIFQIDFHAVSPLQIGNGSLGMIERSLLFVPGRVIWGALTNSIVSGSSVSPSPDSFLSVGNALKAGRFSSFFPLLPSRNGKKSRARRMIPALSSDCFVNEDDFADSIPADEMDALFRCSVESTAIDPLSMSASDNSLHAVELIQPWFCDPASGKQLPTAFRGFIELPDSVSVDDCAISLTCESIASFFRALRIGGGRKRGWGIISPDHVSIVPSYDHFDSIPLNGGSLLTAESPVSDALVSDGRAKLACYREFDPLRGSGHHFSPPQLVWSVGSIVYDRLP